MKGGSMTAILLDTIFLTALSITLNIPLQSLLGGLKIHADICGRSLAEVDSKYSQHKDFVAEAGSMSYSIAATGTEPTGLAQGKGQKFEYSMGVGGSVAARLVDMFAAVYLAAYRYDRFGFTSQMWFGLHLFLPDQLRV